VGLRARLSKLTRARGRAADLAPPLQPAQASYWHR
jgi:hypothetical protein